MPGERPGGSEPATMVDGRGDTRRRGRVTSFDAYVGLGVVTGDDGVEYPFHCVEIADGSRTIDVGTVVAFVPTPKLGRTEAFQLTS